MTRTDQFVARGCGSIEHMQDREHWVRTFPAGRVCARAGCGTRLSVYNDSAHCGAHQPEPPLHYCGYRFRLCPDCSTISKYEPWAPSKRCGTCGHEWGEVVTP